MQNIEKKLEYTLGKKSDLDSRLKSASSSILTQKIEFQESSKPHSSVTNSLKGKYVNLASGSGHVQKSSSGSNVSIDGEGLPHPKQILFKEPLDFSWDHQRSGVGFANNGNSCFLNATMQVLIHCPPLANYMISGHHSSVCRGIAYERCILCSLQILTKKCLFNNGGPNTVFNPKWFNNNLQYIGRHFRCGRQEDAHEFLRLSLEKMQKCSLIGYNGIDKYSKETTVINQIFGGYLRSQVTCLRCSNKSNTYDPLLDVSLDIKLADNIVKAFHQFVAPEKLDNDNAYKCERCKQKVAAIKRFTIHKAPNVLTIQLKRFQFGHGGFSGAGNKVHKPVRYPLHLNIRPFMSKKDGPPITYTLFASIQHEGMSCNSGHYVANVRCKNQWYHFNDSYKVMRKQDYCLNENSAYILFYLKDVTQSPKITPPLKPHISSAAKMQMNGQSYASAVKSPGQNQKQTASLFTPDQFPKLASPTYEQQRNQKLAAQSSQKMKSFPSNDVGTSVKSPFVPLSTDRGKVKFSIGEKIKTKEAIKSPESQPRSSVKPEVSASHPKVSMKPEISTPSPKPRSRTDSTSSTKSDANLLLKVTYGKSFTLEKQPDGDRVCVNDLLEKQQLDDSGDRHSSKKFKKRKIVPYGSDSDSSSSSSSSRRAKSTPVKENGHKKGKLVMDEALKATTSVPGNAHLYNTVTLKDKISHTSSHHAGKHRDLKMFSPKQSSHGSPMRKQVSETLSCDTSSSPAKHSGTGEWHTSFESMQSPSIGSNHSSVHSIGSTQEWSVLKKERKGINGISERKADGWTVTPDRKDVSAALSNVARRNVDIASSPFEDVSDTAYLIKPERPKDKNSEEYRLYKKLKKQYKKNKKRKHLESEQKYAELSEDSVSRSHKKKKKKHKHKHRDEDCDERNKKYEREQPVERPRDVEDKGQKDNEERKEGDIEERSQRIYKREEELDNRQSDRKDDTRRDDDRHHKRKRHRQDSDSSNEFEWVEKPVPVRPSVSEPVTPSHRWDYHVTDGYKRVSSSGTSTPTISRSWDGLKASKVAQELERVSSYGYGAPGWDGGRSQLDADRDYLSRKRKDSDDEFDDEYDRGKVKKVKHKHHRDHYNSNLFQQKQDQINRTKNNWPSSSKPGESSSFNRKHHQPTRPHY